MINDHCSAKGGKAKRVIRINKSGINRMTRYVGSRLVFFMSFAKMATYLFMTIRFNNVTVVKPLCIDKCQVIPKQQVYD